MAAMLVASLGASLAHAQSAARATPRAFEIAGARGSQIGVSIRDITDEEIKTAKLGGPGGVVIEEVTAASPAEKAGLKRGDIVVDYDGERVRSARQFTRLVQETVPDRTVPASVVRDGQRTAVTMVPREGGGIRVLDHLEGFQGFDGFGAFAVPAPPAPPTPPAPPARAARPALPDIETFIWRSGTSLGVTASDLSPQLAEYFGTKAGVLVTSVSADSAAAKAGVKAGDVITSFNGTVVESPAELRRRMQRVEPGDEFVVDGLRDKKAVTLKGRADAPRQTRPAYRSDV